MDKNDNTNSVIVQSNSLLPLINPSTNFVLHIALSCISPNAYLLRMHNFLYYITLVLISTAVHIPDIAQK